MNPLLAVSGSTLARMIREGAVSSRDVVEAHIRHIERVNPRLNAVVADRFEMARQEAVAADRQLLRDSGQELPPFHGVPCTIKESFALVGMPNCAGLVARQDYVADFDATAVKRMRAAGCIPLGVTNTSELCMWMESNNRVYGRTNNPYDRRRIVGGSSGGEGAIVGAGGSPFGLGADIGGSIRMPAFFNGVFGHKPTGGLVPSTGQFPVAESHALLMLTTGPIARRADDLWPLVQILAGPDGQDAYCRDFELGEPDEVAIEDLTVVNVVDDGMIRVHRDLRLAQRRAAEALARRGARVVHRKLPSLKRALPIWAAMMYTAHQTQYRDLMGNGRRKHGVVELLRWSLGRSAHTLPSIGLALFEHIPDLWGDRTQRLAARGKKLRDELVEMIGPRGVMLYPPHPVPAPLHYRPLLSPFNWIYTAVFNATELPVTQVPLGLNARRIPLGVQVVGIHGNDHVTVAVARALEQDFGGWVPPA